jgi:hypothetical protein
MLLSEVVEPLMITSGLVPRRAATNDVKGLADLSEGWYREVKSEESTEGPRHHMLGRVWSIGVRISRIRSGV